MTLLAPPDAQLHEILHLAAQLPNSQRRQRFLQNNRRRADKQTGE
jgi:hypothetical protein